MSLREQADDLLDDLERWVLERWTGLRIDADEAEVRLNDIRGQILEIVGKLEAHVHPPPRGHAYRTTGPSSVEFQPSVSHLSDIRVHLDTLERAIRGGEPHGLLLNRIDDLRSRLDGLEGSE